MFTKGQTVTIKKRGAASELKQYAGNTFTVARGGNTVTLSTPTASDTTTGETSSQTIKVSAASLSASITKN